MSATLPASARLAWWGTAWVRGHVVTDLLIDAVLDDDATHAVAGLAGAEVTETLVSALGRLRTAGATGFGAAFPAEGDPVGLGGPRLFNTAALEAGEAVLVVGSGVGLVPHRVGAAITWTAHGADRRQLVDVGDADRALRAALLDSADVLARLDVARWRPEVADRLLNLRHREAVIAPEGVPARCVDSPRGRCRPSTSSTWPGRTTGVRCRRTRSRPGAGRCCHWTAPAAGHWSPRAHQRSGPRTEQERGAHQR